jgi:hypothetical protein
VTENLVGPIVPGRHLDLCQVVIRHHEFRKRQGADVSGGGDQIAGLGKPTEAGVELRVLELKFEQGDAVRADGAHFGEYRT